MLHLHAQKPSIPVHPLKPVGDALEEGHAAPAVPERIPRQRNPQLPGLADHHIHIRQNAVHMLLPAEVVGLPPEVAGGHTQPGDKGVVLHILGAEGLVEIVQQRDNRPASHIEPPIRPQKARKGAQQPPFPNKHQKFSPAFFKRRRVRAEPGV